MKKTVFALQVVGLIALLPLLVILEMNHAPLYKNTLSGEPGITENVSTDIPAKATSKLPAEGLIMSMETFLLNTTW